jgi:hypothetical protein
LALEAIKCMADRRSGHWSAPPICQRPQTRSHGCCKTHERMAAPPPPPGGGARGGGGPPPPPPSAGSAVMERVLGSAVPRFCQQLERDYQMWAEGQEEARLKQL